MAEKWSKYQESYVSYESPIRELEHCMDSKNCCFQEKINIGTIVSAGNVN